MALAKTNKVLALVVEDDPDTRAIESMVLEDEGFAVQTAKTGEEGIRLAHARPPAVILLDLALPMASGFDVLNMLRSTADTAHIPVVFISAYAHLVEDCVARGAAGCVQKPFDSGELVAVVRFALQTVADEPTGEMVSHVRAGRV